MKNAGIIPNIEKDSGLAFSTRLAEFLEAHGCGVRIYAETEALKAKNLKRFESGHDELFLKSDFIVSLGGDGTMLRVSHSSALFDKPVLGINLGHLGYLTDVDQPGAFDALDKVLKNEYVVQKRMMLNVRLSLNDSCLGKEMAALNDASISRGVFSKMIYFELWISGEFIDTYRADGIIVSTPTGSTAYNLSAGGPIMKPDAEMIAITPICPHMMHSRPHVVSANDTVSIKIVGSADDVAVAIDGVSNGTISTGAEVHVSRSLLKASIIKTKNLGFYDILRNKLVETMNYTDMRTDVPTRSPKPHQPSRTGR